MSNDRLATLLEFAAARLVEKGDHPDMDFVHALRREARVAAITDDEQWIYKIGKLSPKTGEIVVIKFARTFSQEGMKRFSDQMIDMFKRAGHPNQVFLVLTHDFDLFVIDPKDFAPKHEEPAATI